LLGRLWGHLVFCVSSCLSPYFLSFSLRSYHFKEAYEITLLSVCVWVFHLNFWSLDHLASCLSAYLCIPKNFVRSLSRSPSYLYISLYSPSTIF
jgi:hypothetical protein